MLSIIRRIPFQKAAWLSNSRPDCLFEICQLTQVTDAIFSPHKSECIKVLNRALRYGVQNPISISFHCLDYESLHVVRFSDASFANNRDLSSQLGYTIILSDEGGNDIPLTVKSYKARRVTLSVMASEVIAFGDMFDAAFTILAELKKILCKSIALRLLTDSKSVFNVI